MEDVAAVGARRGPAARLSDVHVFPTWPVTNTKFTQYRTFHGCGDPIPVYITFPQGLELRPLWDAPQDSEHRPDRARQSELGRSRESPSVPAIGQACEASRVAEESAS